MPLIMVSLCALGVFFGLGALATGSELAAGLAFYMLMILALAVMNFMTRLRRDVAPYIKLGQTARQQ